ncbi:MAG: hypothetical protein RL477_335, partial [Pseudomonadota bacterium]
MSEDTLAGEDDTAPEKGASPGAAEVALRDAQARDVTPMMVQYLAIKAAHPG